MNVQIARKSEECDLEWFWKIESLATEKDNADLTNKEIQIVYEDKQFLYHDNRCFVTLPWTEDHVTLPTNKAIVQRRTENVVKRLNKEPKLLEKYGEIMAEQENRGLIQKIDATNENEEQTKIHYMPQNAVKKDSTTTPIRIVFNCSCRGKSKLLFDGNSAKFERFRQQTIKIPFTQVCRHN